MTSFVSFGPVSLTTIRLVTIAAFAEVALVQFGSSYSSCSYGSALGKAKLIFKQHKMSCAHHTVKWGSLGNVKCLKALAKRN